MNNDLIININTSNSPLTQLRDAALFLLCWTMWVTVAVSLFNGSGVEISELYVLGLAVLMVSIFLWILLHVFIAPKLRRAHCSPLTLDSLAQHFNVTTDLIQGMQRERLVVVFHSQTGDVTDVRRKFRKYGTRNEYTYAEPLRKAA
jgi:PgaD-like protein